MSSVLAPLPIDDCLAEIVATVDAHRALIVTAAPGAGKTTRVPPALTRAGRVLVLQPRRVAARSMAARVAEERGWTLGREVGWHVRFDRRASADTPLIFATEGILTARLQADPLLEDVSTIVLDEFHERSIHADLGIALAKQAWLARPDLRLVVMSATIDAHRVSAYLGGAPTIHVPGRIYPVEVSYRPGVPLADAALDALEETTAGAGGAVLCFLPGAGEIERARQEIASRTARARGIDVLPLHGGLDAAAQDAALRPGGSARRIIAATNLAETTVTVPDVRAIVDTGHHKVARFDAARGIDRLVLERIPLDSADQRAGRAGRVAAGRAVRLWDARERLRPHREAEILRIDLAATALDIAAWGGDPWTPGAFDWFEAPPAVALDAARALLMALGAVDVDGRVTPLGLQLRRLPLHPRAARLLLADAGRPRAARAAAWLSEGGRLPRGHAAATDSDMLSIVDAGAFPRHLAPLAGALARAADGAPGDDAPEAEFLRAVFLAYADRVARRRERGSDHFVLASGTGARLSRDSGVHHAEFVAAVEVRQVEGGRVDGPLITVASRVDPDWLAPRTIEVVHQYDAAARKVRATRVERFGSLVLAAHPVAPDAAASLPLEWEAWRARERSAAEQQTLARLRFAAPGRDGERIAAILADLTGANPPSWIYTPEDAADPLGALPSDVRLALDRHAPSTLTVPSGRARPLEYREDGAVVAAVKLQEVFGLAASPQLGPLGTPVTFELLAPNGRPVQVTRDLASFWNRGYQEVRKELRGRYPKHPWPDDPWTAIPTARTKR
jgi:ATP-dependent helicase HrpB